MKRLRDFSPCTSGNQLLDTSNSERILKTYTEQIWVNEIVLHSWFLKEASPPFSEPWALLLALREFRPVLSFSGPYCSNCNICKHRAFLCMLHMRATRSTFSWFVLLLCGGWSHAERLDFKFTSKGYVSYVPCPRPSLSDCGVCRITD